MVVCERLAVGQRDEREAPRRNLDVDRGEAGAPMAEVPDETRAAVVSDEPAQTMGERLAGVREEGRPGARQRLGLQQLVAIDRRVVLREGADSGQQYGPRPEGAGGGSRG